MPVLSLAERWGSNRPLAYPNRSTHSQLIGTDNGCGSGRNRHRELTHVQSCSGLNQPEAIGVLDMGFLTIIRKWALRDKMPIREMARRTGVSRNTIKKYLPERIVEPEFQPPDRPSKLDPCAARLTAWLVSDQRKPRKTRRTARSKRFYGSMTVPHGTRSWPAADIRRSRTVALRFLRRRPSSLLV